MSRFACGWMEAGRGLPFDKWVRVDGDVRGPARRYVLVARRGAGSHPTLSASAALANVGATTLTSFGGRLPAPRFLFVLPARAKKRLERFHPRN